MKNMERTSFTFMIEKKQHKDLLEYAKADRRSAASALRNIIADFFQGSEIIHSSHRKRKAAVNPAANMPTDIGD